MIPNIFISSTIQDLSHLRDSIRDTILEIGYNPIMSEYGDIGYLPSNSAEDSCYIALKDCQLAIFILGKRYGSISKNNLSVTHNEFKTARELKQPVIFLVDEEVLSFKKVFDANSNNSDLNFPGMENAAKIFGLLSEFSESGINNGLVQYNNVQSAKLQIKKQLAHIFNDLLKKHVDPTKGEIKDILSEITTLRHILVKNEKDIARQFASTFRFLLNEENLYLKEITETVSGSLEEGVPEILKHQSLKSYLRSQGVEIKIVPEEELLDFDERKKFVKEGMRSIFFSELPYMKTSTRASLGATPEYDIQPDNPNEPNVVFGIGKRKYWANTNADKLLEAIYFNLISNVK
jgi:hypothetical protein